MNEFDFYSLLKDNICVQDEALRKLIWTLYKNFYLNNNFKQNILLVGERGTGKTTMLKEVAELMDIPIGDVYDMFAPGGFNADLLLNGLYKMMINSDDGRGIILLHDFQNSFIYGSSSGIISMIESNQLSLGEYGYFDVSNVVFVGEIDSNQMQHVFVEENDYLADFYNEEFMSPTLSLVKNYIRDDNKVVINENGEKIPSLKLENYISNQIKERFLSPSCLNTFKCRIFMDGMGAKEIESALNSPISVLNLYRDELSDDYINSDDFINKVVYYIMESNDGLHSVSKAIENLVLNDFKHSDKVLKKNSVLFSRKRCGD